MNKLNTCEDAVETHFCTFKTTPKMTQNTSTMKICTTERPVDIGASPLGAVDPGHGDVLQEHHNGERQASRVVVKHGHKVVPGALDKQQAQEEGDDAAHHCGRAEIDRGLRRDYVIPGMLVDDRVMCESDSL